MSTISPTTFVNALRAEGVKIVAVTRNGLAWYNHSRPASLGAFDGHGVVNHHTGPFSTVEGMVSLIWNGRSDLPGPLATITLAPDGTAYLVGWNRCNHAGSGDKDVYNAVLNETGVIPKPNSDDIDGNSKFYGIEVMHPGTSAPYPDAQIQALVKINAAIHRAHGWSEKSSIHHKEWTFRKTDMSWHGTSAGPDLRKLIANCLAQPAGKWTIAGTPAPVPPKPPTPTPTPTPQPGGVAKMVQARTAVAVFNKQDSVNVTVTFSPAFVTTPVVVATPSAPGFEVSVISRALGTATLRVRTSVPGVDVWTGHVGINVIAAA